MSTKFTYGDIEESEKGLSIDQTASVAVTNYYTSSPVDSK